MMMDKPERTCPTFCNVKSTRINKSLFKQALANDLSLQFIIIIIILQVFLNQKNEEEEESS